MTKVPGRGTAECPEIAEFESGRPECRAWFGTRATACGERSIGNVTRGANGAADRIDQATA